MAIAEEIYERGQRCLREAAVWLQQAADGQIPTPGAIAARRTAADMAADTATALLRQAFITPIDREDLWVFWEACEAVLCAVEEVALTAYCCGRTVPTGCANAVIQTAAVCRGIAENFPNSTVTVPVLRSLRDAERTCYETRRAVFENATARRICEALQEALRACAAVCSVQRYCAVKNT